MLGQDDAGPVGLHLRDLAALRAFAARWVPPARASIEPGADELAMALVGAALARQAEARAARAGDLLARRRRERSTTRSSSPRSRPPSPTWSAPAAALLRRARRRRERGDRHRPVRQRAGHERSTTRSRFVAAIGSRRARRPAPRRAPPLAAVADLTFLASEDYAQQRRLTEALIARGLAGRVGAFASWNTTANTVGTALPEAIAVLAGRKLGTYDARAHATFTLRNSRACRS